MRPRPSIRRPSVRRPSLAIGLFASPVIRRVIWHLRRVSGTLDRRFYLTLTQGILGFVAVAAVAITMLEKPFTFESVFDSFNWGIATVLGQGDSAFVTSPGGRVVGWLLILFGVAMLGMITGALVAMVIDFLLKEGQGLGASGFKEHIVVCGWNATARDLIEELRGDDYPQKVVILADVEKNPAGSGVYFVRGDGTDADDLARAGIAEASAAVERPRHAPQVPDDPADDRRREEPDRERWAAHERAPDRWTGHHPSPPTVSRISTSASEPIWAMTSCCGTPTGRRTWISIS
jgi:voltage-gated potassium channel